MCIRTPTSSDLSGFQKWTPPCAFTRGTWIGFPVSMELKLQYKHDSIIYIHKPPRQWIVPKCCVCVVVCYL